MKTGSFPKNRLALMALILISIASVSMAQPPRPVGGVQEHRPGAPFKPLYADDVRAEIKSFVEDIDKMAASVEVVKIDADAPKDQVERQIDGALSLARHRADLVALRDRFSLCVAAMGDHCAARTESAEATDAEKKSMTDCQAHCEKMLSRLDGLHHNSSKLITATRKTYLLKAWDKHREMTAELKSMAGQCPSMFDEAIKASKTPAKPEDAGTAKASDQATYVCPMHPEVTSPQLSKCPKCGMNLVKKD